MVATTATEQVRWESFFSLDDVIYYTQKMRGTNCFRVFKAGAGLKPKHLYSYGKINGQYVLCDTEWKLKWAFVHMCDLHSCGREVFDRPP